jgi:hypothetical protein
MRLFKGRLGPLLVVALAILATGAHASLDWSVGVVVNNLGGSWEYVYTVDNLGTSTEDILAFGLELDPGVTANVTNAPTDWDGAFIAPFVDWVSLDPAADIIPGASLNNFVIESPFGPGSVSASALGSVAAFETLGTTGPVATVIPEASTFALMGLGLALGLLKLRRKKA